MTFNHDIEFFELLITLGIMPCSVYSTFNFKHHCTVQLYIAIN